jgi:tRNA 2-thiouridine synthesizing protein A
VKTALEHHAVLDVTSDVCPLTWVKTKLALERLPAGQILHLLLNDGEALCNVPRSAKEEGHRVLAIKKNDDETYALWIEKDGLR